jgi:hypothetical protein
VREKIRGSQIINFLQNHMIGKIKQVDSSRVTAAGILLRKILPDLTATEHSGELTLTHEQQLEQLK